MKPVVQRYVNSLYVKQEVARLNHGKSTSLSKENYVHIVNGVDYILHHSTDGHYETGIHNIEIILEECHKLYDAICAYELEAYNAALYDVLNHQIPNLFTQWKDRMNWQEMDENLDYPLVDGMALMRDMYGLQGVDLLHYYLKRLKKEMDFVVQFKSEMKVFVSCLDVYTKLSWNMYSLCLYAYIANQVLKNKKSILLTKTDVEEFYRRDVNIQKYFNEDYMKEYSDVLLDSFCLVYQKENEESMIQIQDVHNDFDFNSMVAYLQTLSLKEKIEYLLKENLGIHDFLDVLDTDVFVDKEYIAFFQILDIYTLAILYKYKSGKWEEYLEDYIASSPDFLDILSISQTLEME